MMSRHFALNSELTGAIAKILPHAVMDCYGPKCKLAKICESWLNLG